MASQLPPLRPGMRLRQLGWQDLRRLLHAHRHLVATLLVIGIVIGIVGAVTSEPRYVAETLLMIGDDGVAQSADPNAAADRLQSEAALLHSDAVANRLVQQVGVAGLFPELGQPLVFGHAMLGLGSIAAMPEQMRQAANRAMQRIGVTALPGGRLLRVSYVDADRTTALRALRTVVDSYLQLRVAMAANGAGSSASQMVARDREANAAQLRDIDTKIQKLRSDYQIIDLEQDTASATAQLDDVIRRESQVRERQRAVAAELSSAGSQLQASPQRVFDAQETTAKPLDAARATVLALRLERDHLATQYAPTYPALVELERKIATAEEALKQSGKATVSATRDVRNPAIDQLNNRTNDLRIEAAGLVQQLDALGVDYNRAIGRVTELREAASQMHDLQYRRDVLETVGRQISVRETSLRVDNTVAQARNANVHVIQAPDAAQEGLPTWPLWLAGGALGGVGAAAIGGLLAARLRRTYVLASEVEQHLDVTVLAEFDADDVALSQVGSRQQIAAIAALLADTRVENRPFFSLQAVTPDADEDQRTVAQSLAAELGGRFGLRTLVLDVGADGVAVPVALEGPGLSSALPPALANASLPLWDHSEDALETLPPRRAGRFGAARSDGHGFLHDGADQVDCALALRPASHFTADTLATLRQSCDLVMLLAGGEASGEASRRLSGLVDATMMVVAAERTPVEAARGLSTDILAQGGQMLGVVLTSRSKPVRMW